MDRLQTMSVFRAVAEAGGFAAAARGLNLSPAAVTRAVAALEARLGARLLVRTTRQVRLTEAGVGYLADCRRILAQIAEAEAAAGGASTAPRGELAVTAPTQFGRRHLAPALLPFLEQYPDLGVRLLLVDRIVDLVDEGLDVGLRIGALTAVSLIAVQLGEVRRVVVGSPTYLEANGIPRHPDDLATHRLIAPTSLMTAAGWNFVVSGRGHTVRVRSRFATSQPDVAIDAARAGFGLTRVPLYQVAKEVRSGELAIVLGAFEEPPVPISLVTVEGRRSAAKIRAFVDFMTPRLRALLQTLPGEVETD